MTKTFWGGTRCVLLGTAGLAMTATCAWAQNDAVIEREEIVVTAQRRTQSLQDVPISISALNAQDIERAGFSEFDDYAARIPNLSFSASGSSSTDGALSIAIRGVFGNNTTGFYIDDSPLLATLNPRVVDLERIEVLRGPQGTLYGARSMGGTVRLITVQPDLDEASERGHALISSIHDGGMNYGVDGAVNIPIQPGVFAVRAVGYLQESGGFIDRAPRADAPTPFPIRKNIDGESVRGMQLSGLLSVAGGDLTIAPRIMYEHIKRDGRTQADFTAGNRVNLRQYDIDEPSKSEWTLATLTATYNASFGTFLAASSWFDRSYSDSEDFSEWTTAVLGFQGASTTFSNTDQNIFSQELRFVSSWNGPIDLTAGLFYQRSKSHWRFPQTVVEGFSDDAFRLDNPTKITERAVFAEATWHVTDALRLIAGARAFRNKVDFVLDQGGAFVGPDEHYEGKQDEKGITPKVGIQYDIDEDRMLYFTMSEGFRVGGVNFYSSQLCAAEIAGLGLSDTTTFDSDSLRSYEAGLKSSWFSRQLRLNAAVFQIDWSDLQQRQGLTCGFALNLNAGDARIRGTEVEIDWLPFENTRLLFSVGYVDSEITDTGGVGALTRGQSIQNVPSWTWSASLDQDFKISNVPAFLHLDFSRTGGSWSGNNNPINLLRRPAYEVANARLGAEFGLGRISLFVDNIFDKAANYADIQPLGVQTPGRPRIVVNQPRTIGIEWRRNF